MATNFSRLDTNRPDVSRLMAAMPQAHDAVSRRSWSHPQESSSENWWAGVLADPRARRGERHNAITAKATTMYRLADEARAVVLVACHKCEWRAAFERCELIATHGANCPMPSRSTSSQRRAAQGSDQFGIAVARTTSSRSRARGKVPARQGVSKVRERTFANWRKVLRRLHSPDAAPPLQEEGQPRQARRPDEAPLARRPASQQG